MGVSDLLPPSLMPAAYFGAEVQLPFGDTKGTGNDHREAGEAALDIFTE